MNRRQVRARCVRLMRDLHLDHPLDLEQLRGRMAEQRGKPILVEPSEDLLVGRQTFGFTCDDPESEAVLIMYEARTSQLHQTMIILHELAHMILGHTGVGVHHSYREKLASEFQHLSLDVVTQCLDAPKRRPWTRPSWLIRSPKSLYDERIEREAETMATILLSWTREGGERYRAVPDDPFEQILGGRTC